MSRTDITIAYRIYPEIGRETLVFADDKFRLSALCLRSMVASLKGIRARFFLILDGCPASYRTLFEEALQGFETHFVELSGRGNAFTFGQQLEILVTAESRWVYFAEDDYYYRPSAFSSMIQCMESEWRPDYVTGLDHRDYYDSPVHALPRVARVVGSDVWLESASTCLTFMTTPARLKEDRSVFESYTRGCSDVGLWFALTRRSLFHPRLWWRALKLKRHVILAYRDALLQCSSRSLIGPSRRLFAPQCSLALHLEKNSIPPGHDWKAELETAIDRYQVLNP